MTVGSAKFESEGLTVHVTRHGHEATIAWIGESDARSPSDFLNPLITRFVKDFAGLHVTIDFSGLTYMNSATVAPLIVCIKAFDGAAESVLVVFSDMDWQRTHVQCVRTISRTLKKLKIEVRPTRKAGPQQE